MDTVENNYSYTPRNWYHPVHGEVLQKSYSDLIKMYPGENLNSGNLFQVALGKKFQTKGWRLLENKYVENKRKSNFRRNWYHPIYGEVLQKSATELVKMFPDQKLIAGNLTAVARGRKTHSKGWTSPPEINR